MILILIDRAFRCYYEAPGLTTGIADLKMHVVDPDGGVHSGSPFTAAETSQPGVYRSGLITLSVEGSYLVYWTSVSTGIQAVDAEDLLVVPPSSVAWSRLVPRVRINAVLGTTDTFNGIARQTADLGSREISRTTELAGAMRG